MDDEEIKKVVREDYGKMAKEGKTSSVPLNLLKEEQCSLSSSLRAGGIHHLQRKLAGGSCLLSRSLRAVGVHHVLNSLAGESTVPTSCCDSAALAVEISKMAGHTEQKSK